MRNVKREIRIDRVVVDGEPVCRVSLSRLCHVDVYIDAVGSTLDAALLELARKLVNVSHDADGIADKLYSKILGENKRPMGSESCLRVVPDDEWRFWSYLLPGWLFC